MIEHTIYGLDGRAMTATISRGGQCVEGYVERQLGGGAGCDGVVHHVSVATGRQLDSGGLGDDLDRGIVTAAYCEAHGGAERALADVSNSWYVLAPLAVDDVLVAGTAALGSEDVYVVVRPSGSRWVAAVGIGGHTRSLCGSWPTREAAVEAATAEWRSQVDRDVAEIRRLRGGMLSWGVPVQPRTEPIVIVAAPGQSAYAADRVARIVALLPAATTEIAPVAERWINGTGTIPIDPADADDHATVITAPGLAPIVVTHDDIAWVATQPVAPLRPVVASARNVSTSRPEAIVAAARGEAPL